MSKKRYALLGRSLKHSYSAPIHGLLSNGEYVYELIETQEDGLPAILLDENYGGFNVTIPYKKAVLPYLHTLDKSVEITGAVNTVVRKCGRLFGYNTDIYGFRALLKSADACFKGKKAVILGDGGTSATARAVLSDEGIDEIVTVSRRGPVNYENYSDRVIDADFLINASPVGMYPENGSCLVELSRFKKLSAVFDAVYNPGITRLGFLAKERNIAFYGGLFMLVAQAKRAAELFLKRDIELQEIERVTDIIERRSRNIALIGMPGSGKTMIGRLLAKKLGRPFSDTDALIEEQAGMPVPEIFKKHGESFFRELESRVIDGEGKKNGIIISTGGGAVLRKENYYSVKQNAAVVWIDRPLNLLASAGRPLSDIYSAEELYKKRSGLYEKYSDLKIKNLGNPSDVVEKLAEELGL